MYYRRPMRCDVGTRALFLFSSRRAYRLIIDLYKHYIMSPSNALFGFGLRADLTTVCAGGVCATKGKEGKQCPCGLRAAAAHVSKESIWNARHWFCLFLVSNTLRVTSTRLYGYTHNRQSSFDCGCMILRVIIYYIIWTYNLITCTEKKKSRLNHYDASQLL